MMARLIAAGKQPPSRAYGKRFSSIMQQQTNKQSGFAYAWALMAVLIMGIYLAQVGEAWQNRTQRAKEEELLRVGAEIRRGIKLYSEQNMMQGVQYPKKLEELVQDPRSPTPRRFIRKAYKDPMTGEDWGYISAPGGGFMGVYSQAKGKPLKQQRFPSDFASFANQNTYQDWKFANWPNGRALKK
jgi:type II secretory pathway pseudopilin PulG